MKRSESGVGTRPRWFQTAIIYELHVRSFCDSDGDGVGDFRGLASKLDYLGDLGVTALWLLPFYPSPRRDGGYDIADYDRVDPAYGTLDDFRRFLDEAHRRGLRVITELVINHTSSDHAWFQRARRAPPGSLDREFYVWGDTPSRYAEARIIFKDFEVSNWTWDPVAKAYYWHRFYSHQPDLNFDHPAVHDAVLSVVDTWFGYGVDGLRLDAVPYLFARDGTTCENLPETHAFLKKLRRHVDEKFPDRMLLAEANQWPVDAAAYFGEGDECHMNFHFPLMPRLYMSVEMEDRFPLVDILRQTPPLPDACQWATFLRNHDELSLEMVTEEERDFMYAVYAEEPAARINLGIRRRLAPLVRLRSKIELVNGLLFSMPGAPVIYYGDEIGMGDNFYLPDRDGVRTPMQWSGDRNAGFSRANPQRLCLPVIIDPEYHYEAVNAEAQQYRSGTLLKWMKQLIDIRKQDALFAVGALELVMVDNPRVLAFFRTFEQRCVLVVANLSRYTQHATLELAAYTGRVPLEMFGRTVFPVVTDRPYPLSFAPHQFYWFQLEVAEGPSEPRPSLVARESWTAVVADRLGLCRALVRYARSRRWFRGKAKVVTGSRILDILPGRTALFVILEVAYADSVERYLVPLAFVEGSAGTALEQSSPGVVVATLSVWVPEGDGGFRQVGGVLYDGLSVGDAGYELLEVARGEARLAGEHGGVEARHAEQVRAQLEGRVVIPRAGELDQSNTTVTFGDRAIMKVFRQVEAGVNAEIEVGEALTDKTEPGGRKVAPVVLGALEYVREGERSAVAVFHEYVENQGTAWSLLLRDLEAWLEGMLSADLAAPELPPADPFLHVGVEVPKSWHELASVDVRHARTLGVRTAEVHNALASVGGSAFSPEAFTMSYQQSLYQSARGFLERTFDGLRGLRSELPASVGADVDSVLSAKARIQEELRAVSLRPLRALRVRSHGDLHLGQVLYTGDDFVIIDFEGEPARPLRERRYKRCPLRDVAGMIRSFSYVAESVLRAGRLRERDRERLAPWAMAWSRYMASGYLEAYLGTVVGGLVPPAPDSSLLLRFYLLDKCIYEVAYELNNRPDWLPIPIAGLLELIE